MNYSLRLILSFSIIIPVIISWIRLKKINPAYYPFIFCLWLGLANEITSYIFSRISHSNAVNSNVYVLLEFYFITWQFYTWHLFKRARYSCYLLLGILTAAWILENFFISDIKHFNSYFRILYYFSVVCMSITMVNTLLIRERKSIIRSPIFLICCSFIIYYTYSIVVEAFWVYGLNSGKEFRIKVYRVLLFINVLANLTYSFAIPWMRTKQRFTLPS
jgi:hypothetical protein